MNEWINDRPKEWARLLYTQHGKTIREIVVIVGVEEAAVRFWVQDGGWDNIRRSLLIARNTQLRHLYDLVDKLSVQLDNEEEKNTRNVDLLLKYTAAIKNLEEPPSIGAIIEVAELFSDWLLRRDLGLAKQFTQLLDTFIKQRAA